jgi:hypothetical protein
MDKVMLILNETLPFLGYSGSKTEIGIFIILTKKSKSQFLDHLIESYQIFDPIFEISMKFLSPSSSKNKGL